MADTVKKLSVKFEGDTKGLTTAVRQATASFNDISNAVKVFDKSLEAFGTDIPFDKQAEAADLLNAKIEAAKSSLKQLKEWMEELADEDPANKLTSSFQKLSNKIEEIESEIAKDKKRLSELSDGAVTFANTIKKVKQSLNETSKSANVFKQALDLDPTNVQKQETYIEALKQSIVACKEQQQLLNDQIDTMGLSNADVLSGKYVDLTSALNKSIESQKEYEDELLRVTNSTQVATESTDSFVDSFLKIENLQYIQQFLDNVSNSLMNISKSLFENATSYESSIASIRKVVRDLSDETIDELKQIAVETGSTFDSIAEYATIGATLGIAQSALSEFTQAMVDLETASDGSISGEEGAASVARLLNQFDIGAQYAENFGSAVTYVGDQFAATAAEILETSSRMGGLSAINNVTINDLIGLASEMKNLGIETESGASAITKSFLTINTQVETSGNKLSTFASTAGMSAEEFAKAWKNAPMGAFLSFINGLSTEVFDEINEAVSSGSSSLEDYASALDMTTESFKKLWNQDPQATFEKYKEALGDLEEGSESASVILGDLSLSGVRVAQTLLKLAGNGNVVREAIEDSSKAWDENTNLTSKANEVYETTEYKLKSAKEAISQAAAALGDTFLPIVKDVADIVTSLAKSFNNLPSSTKKASAGFIVVSAALTKLSSMGLNTYIMLDRVAKASLGTEASVSMLATSLSTKLTTAVSALPIVLGAAGVALYAYAGYQAYANRETVKFNNLVKELQETSSANLVSALQNVNTEMVDVNTAYENLNASARNLKLNPDGTIDTTSASYQQLQTDIATLNSYMGGEFITGIDNVTGQFVNQKGEIVNVRQELENLRAEKERQAYLDANEDQYNEMLSQQSEYLGKMSSKFQEIKKTREEIANTSDTFAAFSEEDWNNFDAVQAGYKDISEFSGQAKSNIEQMQSLIAETPLLGEYEDIKEYAEILNQAQSFIEQYNQIDTAPISEVSGLIDSLTNSEKQINIEYNAENIDSLHTALGQVNTQLQTLQQMNAMGFDTSEMQAQYDAAKQKILEALGEAQSKQEEFDGSITNTADNIEAELTGEDGAFTQMANSSTSQTDVVIANFDRIKNYGDIHQNVYVDTHYNDIVTPSASRYINNLNSSGGFNSGFSSLMPNLTIPKLSSGGHSGMVLKASFTINNNGDNITQQTSEKIGRSIVNYINEELGGLI